MYRALEEWLDVEIAARLGDARTGGAVPRERGATWTYLTTDRPFGNQTERILKARLTRLRK